MSVRVLVSGPFACFTRPEMKVERMSYPVMTPSAARGILEAILYKPEFRWHIRRIYVLKPIRWISFRRNEVKEKAPSSQSIYRWMTRKAPIRPIIADATAEEAGDDQHGRTQRNTVALKDVSYIIEATLSVRPHCSDPPDKFYACFNRRVQRGQCFTQPTFGCREFPAFFEPAPATFTPIPDSFDIGWMLYDVFDLDERNDAYSKPFITLFHATLARGVMEVEAWSSVKSRYARGSSNA
jgi:CRISPR-associated protein Cas5d